MNLLKILKEGADQRLAGRKDTDKILNHWIELNRHSSKKMKALISSKTTKSNSGVYGYF